MLRSAGFGWLSGLLMLAVASAAPAPARAQADAFAETTDYEFSGSDWGGIGLLQTRTARVARDGNFDIGFSRIFPYNRFAVTWQILPRLEATFRFSAITNSPLPGSAQNENFKDRGFDLKYLLVDEGKYRPAIAVGLQDTVGTGVFGGEYVVASKRYYDLDFSFGLGWGYNGASGKWKNPLRLFSGKFKSRGQPRVEGGTLRIGSWFAGETISPFGGVEYHTPIRGLTLKAEYDGNNYKNEPRNNRFDQKSPINAGITYRPFSWFDTSLGFERGTSVMFRGAFRFNLHKASTAKFDPPPVPVIPRERQGGNAAPPPPRAQDRTLVPSQGASVDLLFDRLERQGLEILDFDISGSHATVMVEAEGGPIGYLGLRQAARTVYESLPVALSNVTFVQFHGQNEQGRLTVGPGDLPAFAAADWLSLSGPKPKPEAISAVPLIRSTYYPDEAEIADRIRREIEDQGLDLYAVEIGEQRVTVFVRARKFRQAARNIGRAARVVANHAPPSAEEITVVLLTRGIESGRITVMRTGFERAALNLASAEEIWSTAVFSEAQGGPAADAKFNLKRYPNFNWSLQPAYRQSVGGGDVFFTYQFLAALAGRVELRPGLTVTASIGQNLTNNFDKFVKKSDSRLPKVRSNIREYLKEGTTALTRFDVEYIVNPRPRWYGRVYAGLLEFMYAGVGTEVLYRPVNSRWAVGSDIMWVKQRSFKQRFAFRDFDTVTGHVSGYYESPFLGLSTSVHVGRFLARDWGGTVVIGRRFDSGISVGAFATITDVPFNEFGEGSFDKGFHITIPFDVFTTTSNRRHGTFAFRPLTRDGGQMVVVGKRLIGLTGQGSYGNAARYWETLLD